MEGDILPHLEPNPLGLPQSYQPFQQLHLSLLLLLPLDILLFHPMRRLLLLHLHLLHLPIRYHPSIKHYLPSLEQQ